LQIRRVLNQTLGGFVEDPMINSESSKYLLWRGLDLRPAVLGRVPASITMANDFGFQS
jgi:hypothetical protein